MAKDIKNDLSWYLMVESKYKNDLADIRHFQNLKVAFDEDKIWVTGFTWSQIEALEVKVIPFKKVYFAKNGKLFLQNSQLPDRNIPSLLWTPIDRALPIDMPDFNHNYFGIEEKISVKLIPVETEKKAAGMMVDFSDLENCLKTIPAFRLKNISWTILENEKALLIGSPLLPIKGDTFWLAADFLIPTGFDFDLQVLKPALNKSINPEREYWVRWNADGTYIKILKNHFNSLSLEAFRRSIN